MLAKLRTPLGKPQDTFTSIEATLKKLSTEVRNLDAGDVNSSSPSHLEKGKTLAQLGSCTVLVKLWNSVSKFCHMTPHFRAVLSLFM